MIFPIRRTSNGVKLFLDTCNLAEIEKYLKLGVISGITTNPGLVVKEPKTDYLAHMGNIVELCRKYNEVPLSVMVTEGEPAKMLAQAREFVTKLAYSNLAIKIPVGWEEARVIRELEKNNIKVNCTCCMTQGQVLLGAQDKPRYLSIFYNQIKDAGGDPVRVIKESSQLLKGAGTEIIVGSIRHFGEIPESFLAGADIVTAPPEVLAKMAFHPKTKEELDKFHDKFIHWGEN